MSNEQISNFSLDGTLKSLFDHGGKIFGLEFQEEQGAPHDMQLFSVLDGRTHEKIGALYVDPYNSALKTTFSAQSGTPTAIISMGITRPAPGREPLLSIQEVATTFNLYGHALHHLLSKNFHGIPATGANDFVELPSNFMTGLSGDSGTSPRPLPRAFSV